MDECFTLLGTLMSMIKAYIIIDRIKLNKWKENVKALVRPGRIDLPANILAMRWSALQKSIHIS